MLNFYYLYVLVWLPIIFIYSLGWSDLYEPLAPDLKLFFTSTILLSAVLGYKFRKCFRFYKIDKCPTKLYVGTLLILIFSFYEFYYCDQIPLFAIISGRAEYTSFTGIKTLHVINTTFAGFYAQYLFYLFVCYPKHKIILLQYLAILFTVNVLVFNRGGLIISLAMSALIFVSSLRKGRKTFVLSIGILLSLVGLYYFGGFGNIRHGNAWNDTTMIERLGKFNDGFPSWLPKQYMWAYIYIVSGLGNLNHNIILDTSDFESLPFLSALLPDFLHKRLPEIYQYKQPKLVEKSLTVVTGFGNAYMNSGILGMYAVVFILYGFLFYLLNYLKPAKRFFIPYIAIMSSMVLFLFFTSTLSFSGISFPLVYPILTAFKFRPFKRNKGLLEIKK